MTSPRILHVGLESPQWRIGGLNRYLSELVRAQDELGTTTSVVWIDDGGEKGSVPSGLSWPHRVRAFARQIRQHQADVIDVHFPAHAAYALATGAFRRRPFIVHFQGPWALESAVAGSSRVSVALKSLVEGYVLRRAERVVTLSSAFRAVAVERYGVAPHLVDVIAPGVSPADAVDRKLLRSRLGCDEHITFVIVRRLTPRMGIDRFVEFFAREGRTNEALVIIGDGDQRRELEDLVQKRGVADRVRFLGRVDDETLRNWYEAADVSIVPTVAHEGFGLVVLESLAHGTPVVVTDVDGLRDAARVSEAVQVVSAAEPAWRAAIDVVLENPDLRAMARRDARGQSWTRVAERHARLYDEVAHGDAPRGVVVLDHTAKRSGGELALARVMSALDDRRWRAHVVLGENGPLTSELDRRGLSYEVVPMDPATQAMSRDQLDRRRGRAVGATLSYAWHIRRIARRRQPVIVHTNSMKAHVYGIVASVFAPWRVVLHARDLWSPPYVGARTARFLRLLATWGPDDVIANSRVTGRSTSVNAAVIPSPVEDVFFDLEVPTTTSEVRFGIIGRLAPWKGQDLVIEAANLLRDEPGWTLRIVGGALFGEDAYADELTNQVDRLGLSDRVSFTGAVDDVSSEMGELDAVILASRSPEPFGNVIAEAMAAGRVVIVPNEGGVMEFVGTADTDPNGVVFAATDVASLAAAMRFVIHDAPRRVRMGAAARVTAEQFHSREVASVLERLYDDLG